jgi:hypothetical protein
MNHPHTKRPAVFVAVDNDDEVAGTELAKDAAHAAYSKLNAKDPKQHPDNPDVQAFTDGEPPTA